MAVVEFELSHAGNVSKERHSIVFQPLLGVGETQNVSVGLRIRTPERSEDVALLGWRTISASGFGSGGDPPTSDENGFQIVKNPTDPFAAYGGHLVRATIPAAVAVGLLLQKTQPIYPPIAKAARVSGTVVLEATISKAGTVEELRVISGPPFLQQAALDAVKTWRYKPYTVNDEPVEVETTVNVVFTLGD
jgi:TonB family protein